MAPGVRQTAKRQLKHYTGEEKEVLLLLLVYII
jgi:hypothetical protein